MDSFRPEDSEPRSTGADELVAEVLASFRRYKALFGVMFVATVLGAYGVGQLRTELYETTAKILVKLGRENIEVPATVQKGSVLTSGVRKEELHTEMQMLSSQSLIEEVIDQLGVEAFAYKLRQPATILQKVKSYVKQGVRWGKAQIDAFLIVVNLKKEMTAREKILAGIEGALSVEAEKDSQIITVKLLYPDPELAVRVLSTLLHLYLDRHVRIWQEVEVKDFFDSQVAAHKQKLREIEGEKEKAKAQWNLISIAEQRTLLLQQLQNLHNQIYANQTETTMLQARQASMRDQLKTLPDELRQSREIRSNPSIQSIKERLTNLEQEYARLSTLYRPDSSRLQNLNKEIVELRRLLQEEDSTLVWSATMRANPLKQDFMNNIQEVEVQVSGLKASAQELRAQTADLEEQLQRLNAGERQLTAIEREYQLAEQEYLDYVKRRGESFMAQELDRRRIVNVAVLSPPDRSLQPVFPRKLFIVSLSFPLGLLLGGALVLLAGYMNDVVETPRDISHINGLTYLGTFHFEGALILTGPDSQDKKMGVRGALAS